MPHKTRSAIKKTTKTNQQQQPKKEKQKISRQKLNILI